MRIGPAQEGKQKPRFGAGLLHRDCVERGQPQQVPLQQQSLPQVPSQQQSSQQQSVDWFDIWGSVESARLGGGIGINSNHPALDDQVRPWRLPARMMRLANLIR